MPTNRRSIRRPRKIREFDPSRWWRTLKIGTDYLNETGNGHARTFRGDPKMEELARRVWFAFGQSLHGIGADWWAYRTFGRPDGN